MNLLLQILALVSIILIYIFISDVIMKGIWRILKVQRNENFFIELFYNVLLFALILVFVTALVATNGKTIFIITPVVLYLFYRLVKNKIIYTDQIYKENLGYLWVLVSIISLITVALSFFIILKFSIRNDVSFYTKITECLIPQGLENPFHHYNNENRVFIGNVPYHYFEMWFGGLCFKIADIMGIKALSNYLIYIFFVFNLFRVLVVVGIFGLVTKYNKLSYVHFIVVFLLLSIDISAYCNWGNDSYVAESNLYERPNFIFYYLFLIPIFHSILNDSKEQLTLWSAIFIMGTVTALPAIAGSIFLYNGFDWFWNKTFRKKIVVQLAWFVAFLIYFSTFYKIFGVSKDVSLVEAMTTGQIIAKTLSIWKACVFMFLMLFFKVGIIILASVVIIRRAFPFMGNRQFIKLHFFTLLVCLCGIGIFQLIPFLDNMYQFAFIGYCAVALILMVVISIKLQNLNGTKFCVSLLIFLLIIALGYKRNLFFEHILIVKPQWSENIKTNFLLQNNLSREYIEKIEGLPEYVMASKGASLIDEMDALDEFLGLRHSMTYQLGNYLMVINNNMHLPLLSDPEKLYPDTDKKSKDYYKAIAFNRKTAFYSNYNKEIPYKQNLRNYISKNEIKYIIASKHLNPFEYFDSLSINNVIADANKGHQFIILNNVK